MKLYPADLEISKTVYLSGPFDPRVEALEAPKNAVYRYTGTDPALQGKSFIKNDNGETGNWDEANISSGGVNPTLVKVVSTQNVDLTSAPADIDGVTLVENDLILCTRQGGMMPWEQEPEKNGVYKFTAEGAPLTRASGWDTAAGFLSGRLIQLMEDTASRYRGSQWYCRSSVTTLETDPILFWFGTSGRIIAESIEPYENGMVDLGNEREFASICGRMIRKIVRDGSDLLFKAPNSGNAGVRGDGILLESGSGGTGAMGGDIKVKAGNYNDPGRFVLERVKTFKLAAKYASDPTGAEECDIYYNTVSKKFRFFNGSVWADI